MAGPMNRAALQGMERAVIQELRDGELERFKKEVYRDILVAAGFGQTYKNIYVTNWVTLGKALMLRRSYNTNEMLKQDELNILLDTCMENLKEMFLDVDINIIYRHNEPYIHVNWS